MTTECIHCRSIPDENGLCPSGYCPCEGMKVGSREAARASSNRTLGYSPAGDPASEPSLPSVHPGSDLSSRAEILRGIA